MKDERILQFDWLGAFWIIICKDEFYQIWAWHKKLVYTIRAFVLVESKQKVIKNKIKKTKHLKSQF